MEHVKRRYDATGRQQQARRNRNAILDVAQRRFQADGYATTTVAAVASEAGVSVETIYKAFGGKSGLVTGIWERGLLGPGPVAFPERSDAMQRRESDPRAIIGNWGKLTTEVMPLVAPILLLIRSAAATDPDMARVLADTDRQRLQRMRHNIQALTPHLRPGLTHAAAGELLWLYSAPDLFDLLVLRRRWSLRRYGRFVTDSLIGALLP